LTAVVATVLHPGAAPFWAQFCRALRAQEGVEFALVAVLDGVAEGRARAAAAGLDLMLAPAAGDPAANRAAMLGAALAAGATRIILADADDWCPPGRVAACLDALERAPLVAHDLRACRDEADPGRRLWAGRLGEGAELGAADLLAGNCLGLTNTALRAELLDPADPAALPGRPLAFDWAFFAALMHRTGISARFLTGPETCYRQHEANMAPIGPEGWTDAALRRGVEVRARHHRLLADFDPAHAEAAPRFEALAVALDADPELRRRYGQAARAACPAQPLWWEPVRPREALGV